MSRYTIVASDLDGTLLLNDSTLSPENSQAITMMRKKGVQFAPASGRTLSEMPSVLLEHPDIRFYIYSNGAAIWDKQTDHHTHFCMSQALTNRVLDTLSSYQSHITIRQGGRGYTDVTMQTEEDYRYYQVHILHRRVLEEYTTWKQDFMAFARALDQVESFGVFFHDDAQMEACQTALQAIPGISVTTALPHSLEVFSDKAGKGVALCKIADILQVSYDTTIAVGDSGNDLSMLQAAALGLVPRNACDSLKAAADAVICSNEEHVAQYIANTYL